MLARLISRCSFANVASGLALFIALTTGTVYAANEWTGLYIVDGSLSGVDIGNNSLSGVDIRADSLTGPTSVTSR